MNDAARREDRPLDLVVWGATGFAGALVAEYLATRAPEGLRWAIGGRSLEKLEGVRTGLAEKNPALAELPCLVGDSHDAARLAEIAKMTRVVLTTVGPYAAYGHALVAACVEAGTDYCDLTGETQWVREMIDRHHEAAKKTGARIVHCCGVDSIPSDLGTLVLQEHAKARYGAPFRVVKCFAGEMKGGASGGTLASGMLIMEQASKDRDLRRLLVNPYALAPDPRRRGPDVPDQRGVRFDHDIDRWTGPFVMAAINARVVRRTNALLGYAWGEDFSYSEAMSFPRGPKGLAAATMVAGGLGLGVAALALKPVRELAKRKMTQPGEGPSKEERDRGYFVFRLVGLEPGGRAGKRALCTVRGKGDPGYAATARMITESALALLEEPRGEGGVLTPASAIGTKLAERLAKADVTFDVEDLS